MVTDAFGVVAMVAMTPLIAIQMLGVSYRLHEKRARAEMVTTTIDEKLDWLDNYEIIAL